MFKPEDSLKPMKQMLKAGVPKLHIQDLAEKHLIGIKRLDDSTEFKNEVIKLTEDFIEELKSKK